MAFPVDDETRKKFRRGDTVVLTKKVVERGKRARAGKQVQVDEVFGDRLRICLYRDPGCWLRDVYAIVSADDVSPV